MTPKKIKKIRERLKLTQEELATILGVTKMTVWRYESGGASPSDDVAAKLASLDASLSNAQERKKIKALRSAPGGLAAIAAVTTMGTAIFPTAAATGTPLAGCVAIAASPAGAALLKFLQSQHDDLSNDNESARISPDTCEPHCPTNNGDKN